MGRKILSEVEGLFLSNRAKVEIDIRQYLLSFRLVRLTGPQKSGELITRH